MNHRDLPPGIRSALAAAGLSFAAFVVLLVVQPGGAESTRKLEAVALMLPALVAAVLCRSAWRREHGRVGLGWLALACSAAAWGFGQAVSCYHQLQDKPLPFPSLADAGYLAAVPCAVVAMVLFAGPRSVRSSWLRLLLDTVVVGGSVLFVSWISVLGPLYHSGTGQGFAGTVSFLYPLGDVVVGSVVLVLAASSSGRRRLPLGLIAAGLIVLAFADSGFTYLTMTGTYAVGNVVDYGWFAGYLLVGLAAVRSKPVGVDRTADEHASPAGLSTVYVPVLVAVGAAIGRVAAANPLGSFPKELAAGVIVALVARELLRQTEATRLDRRLDQDTQFIASRPPVRPAAPDTDPSLPSPASSRL